MCIATGPSLEADQVKRVMVAHSTGRVRVIAVNEAGLPEFKPLAAPFADILYAADDKWWRHYNPDTKALKVSADKVGKVEINGHVFPAIKTRQVKIKPDMPARHPGVVMNGSHSGFQALGLAVSLGAARIILLGYDCGGGKRNCHDNRPGHLTTSDGAFMNKGNLYAQFVRHFPDVEIINCSQRTEITAFPVRRLREVI